MADEIDGWLGTREIRTLVPYAFLHKGDWRTTLADAISHHAMSNASVVFIEMDPMRFEHNPSIQCARNNKGVLYVEDLGVVSKALSSVKVPTVIQLSSYSADNGNSHTKIEPCITAALVAAGFALQGKVEADGNMISLVYSRNVCLWTQSDINEQFKVWKNGIV